ncbi:hypothetical protein D3C78_974100 [compost metagenome]
MGTGQIGGPDGGRQAVIGGVGHVHHFVFAIERRDVAARAENLFLDHGSRFRQTGPNSRLYPGAVGQIRWHVRHTAASHQGGTLFHRLAVVGQYFLLVLLADQRAVVGLTIIGATVLDRLCLDLQGLDEAFENRPFDIHPFGAQAHLSGVEEHRAREAFHRGIKIGVGKHDAGVLAAQFERHVTHALGRGFHDGRAGAGLTGKGDGIDVRVLGDELASRIRTKAVHHVVHTLGDAHRVHYFAEQGGRLRRLFGGFDHHGIAAGQGRADLPGHQHERRIPRTDHADHPLGPTNRVIQGTTAIGGVHLEGFAGDVLDHIGKHFEVGRAARDEHMLHDVLRLAGVGHLGLDEVIETAGDFVCHAVEQLDALIGGQATPLTLQGIACGADGSIDLATASFTDRANDAVIHRRMFVETLATGSGDKFTGDEVFNLAHGNSGLLFCMTTRCTCPGQPALVPA